MYIVKNTLWHFCGTQKQDTLCRSLKDGEITTGDKWLDGKYELYGFGGDLIAIEYQCSKAVFQQVCLQTLLLFVKYSWQSLHF